MTTTRPQAAPLTPASPLAALTHRFDPRLLAAAGSFCIALSSVFIKVSGASGSTSALWRCLFSLPFLAALAWRERKLVAVATPRPVLVPLAAGIGLGLDFVLWGEAIPRVGAGIATVLLAVQVIIMPALALVFFRERPSKRFLGSVPVLLTGIALAGGFLGTASTGSDPVSGAAMSLCAGAAYAVYLLLIRRTGPGALVHSLLLATVSAAVVAITLGTATGKLDLTPGWPALGWLLALALVGQVAGWLLIATALPRMTATVGATLMLLQPIGAVLFGVVLLGETPGVVQLAGCATVVAAVCFAAGGGRGRPLPELEPDAPEPDAPEPGVNRVR